MDEQDVRRHAEAFCEALMAGNVDRAIEDFSKELHQNLGEVVALLPLPSSQATIESIERGGSSFVVALRLVGENDEVVIETRWKDRDGRPTIVEASHLSRTETAAATDGDSEADGDGEA